MSEDRLVSMSRQVNFTLSAEQVEIVRDAMNASPHPEVRHRATAIHLLHRGHPPEAVAEMLAQTFSEFEREARTNLDGINKICTEGGQWYAFCFGSALGRPVRPPGSADPPQDVKAKTHSA